MTDPEFSHDPASEATHGVVPSFRDPGGTLLAYRGRLLRVVTARAADELFAFLRSRAAGRALEAGQLVRTTVLEPAGEGDELEQTATSWMERFGGGVILEHERIPFPSFPYEWPPEMLHAAAVLTLDLAQECLQEGFGLKDATPYNVLFRGPAPVFVDVLSFERRHPGDPTWRSYAQFVRTFVVPLLLWKHYGLPLDQLLLARRDGLEPEAVYRMVKAAHKIRPPFLTLVSIPKWLGRTLDAADSPIYRQRVFKDTERAHFVLDSLFGRLRRSLRRAKPKPGRVSEWSSYMQDGDSYSAGQFAAKTKFVSQALGELHPKRVLDVGCNTGHFSALAAEGGAGVVAIDQDPVVVGETWRLARSRGLDILPLVVDLSRPSPATGWLNRECPSFLDRSRGGFDLVLMLAVVHHLLVTQRVPLESIVDLAAGLTRDAVVIEFIGPQDPQFRRLLRGRDELHQDLSRDSFEAACGGPFEIASTTHLAGSNRWLYLLRKRKKQGAPGSWSAHV